MALEISAAQARSNMAAVREQWVAAHLEQISAVISAASDSGEMAASYELMVGANEESALEQIVDTLTGQGFDVTRREKRLAIPRAVTKKVARTAAGAGVETGTSEEELRQKAEVVLDISWAEEPEESEEESSFSLPSTPAPLI